MNAVVATQKLAVMFADISGSTALYDRLGDEQARRLISACMVVMTQEMSAHGGTLIKTIGDEIMCTFPTPAAACEAACAMQYAVEQARPGGSAHPMYIRIGFHYGEVICEEGDVYGDTVNVAARVTSITRARQILATRAAVEAMPAALRTKSRQIMRAELRGKQEALDVFQVSWEQDDTLSTRIGLPQFRKPSDARTELLLRYRQQVVTLNEQCRSVVLGREDSCDMAIHSNFASRQHARIELSFTKFLLIDHSSNGTYVRFSDGQIISLAHEQIVLHKSGVICLGESFADEPTELIEFILQ
ncbi:MAG: adenylate/guanylate cyclase domain-containing protein [Gallionella sp.]|nr:adenylate/guanylate cyclase domain-containing protein [Gallionella sp.]